MTNFVCNIPSKSKWDLKLIPRHKSNCMKDESKTMSSMTMNLGRGMSNVKVSTPSAKDCVCDRPRGDIICINCGFKGFGRIQYTCSRHPETVFLFDWTCCPNCKGSSLYSP